MLKFIGVIILWPIVVTILSSIFNTARVKAGADINDWISQMLMGFALGPLGVLLGLFPFRFYWVTGAMGGTYWGYQLYQIL